MGSVFVVTLAFFVCPSSSLLGTTSRSESRNVETAEGSEKLCCEELNVSHKKKVAAD